DLGSVTGSGPEGRIVERDIQALIAAHEVSAPATTSSPAPVQATPAHAPSIAAGGLVAAPAVAGLTRRETVRIDAMRRIIAERIIWFRRQRFTGTVHQPTPTSSCPSSHASFVITLA
ncbi:MAG: hypothetical protein EBT47_12415, partial [Chloroflexi bacterium]|nr:hypothetical protein [Chloroflexota bacterium]